MNDFEPEMRINPEADRELMEATESLFETASLVRSSSTGLINLAYSDEPYNYAYTFFYDEEQTDFSEWVTPVERSFNVVHNDNSAEFMQIDCQGTLRSLHVGEFSSLRYLSFTETESMAELLAVKHPNIKQLTRALFVLTDVDFAQNQDIYDTSDSPTQVSYTSCGIIWPEWLEPRFRQFWRPVSFERW